MLREEGGGARGAGEQQCARRILVEPVDQFGPPLGLELERVEQPVDMLEGLGAALRREAGRLVEHDRLRILVDHHLARECGLIVAERGAVRLGLGGAGLDRFGRGHADHLAGGDAIARIGARAVDAELTGARPARDDVEAGVGQMPLEPAIEADAVVVGGDAELADVGAAHATALAS